MATEYTIEIYRKADNKMLGIAHANCLKSIMDTEFQKLMHLDGRCSNNAKFTVDDIEATETAICEKVKALHSEIFEKKLMIACAKSKEVMHELEEDIVYLNAEIDEDLKWAFYACARIRGTIECIVEDQIFTLDEKDEDGSPKYESAYIRNGRDLPMEERTYSDGTVDKFTPTVWAHDVYCVVKADY